MKKYFFFIAITLFSTQGFAQRSTDSMIQTEKTLQILQWS